MCSRAGCPSARARATWRLDPIARIGPFSPGPSDLLHIHELLDGDACAAQAASEQTRRERDRALGKSLPAATPPLERLQAWRSARARDSGHTAVDGAMSTLAGTVALVGALAGAAAASGAFFYDGAGRVNVLLLVGLFALLPLASVVLFALACVSGRGLRGINTGRLGGLAARLLHGSGTRELAGLATGSRGPEVAKWLLLAWSQWIALGFGIGALTAAMALVVFTDLAFGWSTTLDVSAIGIHELVGTLALPWRGLLPAASPGETLVEATRYFRLARPGTGMDPELLGRWWPFVVTSMLVYGTLPRLLTLPFAHWRLARACAASLLADPRVRALLDRMNTPLVETRSGEAEAARAPAPGGLTFSSLPTASAWYVVNWADVPLQAPTLERLLEPARLIAVHAAGGARGLAADRELARRLAAAPDAGGVLVVARGFDPPTLDLMDFLADLREQVAAARPVAIAPVALEDLAPAALEARHAQAWSTALARQALDGVQLVAPGRGPKQ